MLIPELRERNAGYNAYLPVTTRHPKAQEPFRRPAQVNNPAYADLGLWNVYLNPDLSVSPAKHEALMGLGKVPAALKDQALSQSIARFKTPGLRDLGDSGPYLHNGSKLTIEEVADFYQKFAQKARRGEVRNADPQMQRVVLVQSDTAALAAFLKSLKEDFGLEE